MYGRRVLSLLALIFLIISLSACHATEPSQTIPVHDLPTTEPIPLTLENLVTPAISESYRWVDGVDNLNEVTIVLPHLDSGRKCAAAFNTAINDFAAKIITEVEESVAGGYSTFITSVGYEAFLNGHHLSIVVTTQTSYDYAEYDVYNFDLEDDEVMTTADMCDEYLDMEYPVFLKYTRDRIWAKFETEFAAYFSQYPGDHEFMRHLYLSDLSTLCNYGLYFNKTGQLMLICDYPSIAGAAYYPSVEAVTSVHEWIPAEADTWNWLFDLYLGADFDNQTFAEQLLHSAFDSDPEDFMQYLQTRSPEDRDRIETAIRTHNTAKG